MKADYFIAVSLREVDFCLLKTNVGAHKLWYREYWKFIKDFIPCFYSWAANVSLNVNSSIQTCNQ